MLNDDDIRRLLKRGLPSALAEVRVRFLDFDNPANLKRILEEESAHEARREVASGLYGLLVETRDGEVVAYIHRNLPVDDLLKTVLHEYGHHLLGERYTLTDDEEEVVAERFGELGMADPRIIGKVVALLPQKYRQAYLSQLLHDETAGLTG